MGIELFSGCRMRGEPRALATGIGAEYLRPRIVIRIE